MPRPIAIDLFAGAGGMSLGFEQAGFDVVAAIEVDPIHAAVHKFNFPDCAVICRDASKVSSDDIRSAAGIGRRKVDLVVGGAPCQGFSLIGQRALDDPRNSLVGHFVRIVKELKADRFVFENVKGLTLGKHRRFLEELVEAFSDEYNIRLPWRVLNAADFGVPQQRERLILMGARKGLRLPDYPSTTHAVAGSKLQDELQKTPDCSDALGDLPNAEAFDLLWQSDEIKLPRRAWKAGSAYAKELRCLTNDCWHYGHPRIWDASTLTSSLRTEHTDISRRRFEQAGQGKVEPISRLFKLPKHGLSNTLRAGTDAARGAFTSPRPIHYEFPRLITVREMARLHGFPDWFRLHSTKWHGARQIGNAVPPPLARAIGKTIIASMGIKPTRPVEPVALGPSELLRLDMQQAAAWWNIQVPIARRDRKSGAKKRKQHEIPETLVAAE
ncbi:MAG: DNA cytosine methyltransferase [Rhodoblastus sp.]